ncbi:hypothetical protein WICPIJ_003444 [Wickerhamomyces pijperi]|uniref:Uncharacterized protein n=1 Tax=Wickerhamomyces pijperi TaxID=599730 RepID=A0A9P8Q7T3_WICPI|nr:hypothetical protein WICPIJ_003444 [Wickerhamomyces pijperi]
MEVSSMIGSGTIPRFDDENYSTNSQNSLNTTAVRYSDGSLHSSKSSNRTFKSSFNSFFSFNFIKYLALSYLFLISMAFSMISPTKILEIPLMAIATFKETLWLTVALTIFFMVFLLIVALLYVEYLAIWSSSKFSINRRSLSSLSNSSIGCSP